MLTPVAPEQAVNVSASNERVRRQSIGRDFRRVFFPPRKTNAGMSNAGAKRTDMNPNRREADEFGVVVIVMVTVADPLPGVNGFGVKLHCASAGRPEHESVTAFGKDEPTGLTVNA